MLPGSDALFDFSVQGVPEGIVFPMDQKGTPRIVVYSPRGNHRIRWAGLARLGGGWRPRREPQSMATNLAMLASMPVAGSKRQRRGQTWVRLLKLRRMSWVSSANWVMRWVVLPIVTPS
jgi:hypothetical protein